MGGVPRHEFVVGGKKIKEGNNLGRLPSSGENAVASLATEGKVPGVRTETNDALW